MQKQAEFNNYIEKKVDGVIETQKTLITAQKETDKKVNGVIKAQKETGKKVNGVIKTQKAQFLAQKETDRKVEEVAEKLERVIKLNKLKS
ncbi:MAG: hypothetical protein LBC44_02645 [Mycoplasmataceae bacterium]|nr:hypothetical protein [Mycoplasmataceae bacterium]